MKNHKKNMFDIHIKPRRGRKCRRVFHLEYLSYWTQVFWFFVSIGLYDWYLLKWIRWDGTRQLRNEALEDVAFEILIAKQMLDSFNKKMREVSW
tara:strand:- start:1177 stop:1458 length:282 start_codon:yes stop_codon:yes gene_type:complete